MITTIIANAGVSQRGLDKNCNLECYKHILNVNLLGAMATFKAVSD